MSRQIGSISPTPSSSRPMMVASPWTTMPDRVAVHVSGATRRVGAQMPQARRAAARGDGEPPPDEDAVERGHPRLALPVHRRERNVLRPLQIVDDLPRVEAPLRFHDAEKVWVRAGESPVDQRLQLPDLVLGLEHRRAREDSNLRPAD
jgi:hypothetical protein